MRAPAARTLLQVELLHLVAERVAGNAEQPRRLCLIAVGLLERTNDQCPLVVFERDAFSRDWVGIADRHERLVVISVNDADRQTRSSQIRAVLEDHRTLDR